MSTLLTFRTGTGINSYVVHVSNDDRFPQTISTTTGTSWYVTTGASCWIDTISYENGYSGARAKCSETGNDWDLTSDKYVGTSTTRNITVYATAGSSYSSNPIYFRTGTGVSSYTMQYANSTSTANTDSITGRNTSTTLYVRENTNASLIRLNYEDGYGGPFYFVEYTSSSFSRVKKTFEDGDPDVYSSGTRYIKLFATESTTTAYIKLGAGVSSAMIYVDGVAKSDVRDKAYHAITVNSNSRVEVRSIGLTSGYQKPYIFRFYRSSGATTPSSTSASQSTDTPYYTYTSDRVYAEIVATKKTIDPFYWQNATWDAANIKAGQPISNLTAVRWNSLLAKIKELAEAEGGSYSYSGVSSGGTIYATTFNAARAAISNRSGYGTLPAAQSKGNSVKAALFEGSGSLKSALNAAISYHNNS